MWVDHLLWYLLHNLDKLFPLSSIFAKLFACFKWIYNPPSKVKGVIVIYFYFHDLMLEKQNLFLILILLLPISRLALKELNLFIKCLASPTSLNPLSHANRPRNTLSPFTPFTVPSSANSSQTRCVQGERFKALDLKDIQNAIDWSL